MIEKLKTWVLLACLCAALVMFFLWRHSAKASFDSAMRADSTAAAADRTKRVLLKMFNRSNTAWMRRVVQQKQVGDSIDKALKWERKVKTVMTIQVDTGKGTVAAPVTVSSDDIRSAQFDTALGPFQVNAFVQLPPPPADGNMNLTIALKPISLDVRLGCGAAIGGVRRADLTMIAPEWAPVTVDSVQSAVEVCNSGRPQGWRLPWWMVPIAGAIGFVLHR